jgi:hypothetical protein
MSKLTTALLTLFFIAVVSAQTSPTTAEPTSISTVVQCFQCPCGQALGQYQPTGCPLCLKCSKASGTTAAPGSAVTPTTTSAPEQCSVCSCGEFGTDDGQGCSKCMTPCSGTSKCAACVCGYTGKVANGCNICTLCPGNELRTSSSATTAFVSCGLATAVALLM